ncbi:JDVT-CTERM system glutamic-type intramembrane protease MrtJ [Salinisphaera sp.]|uniref:JDVT-CTERM system glutamic-type intramembrane protease MrtJ n=1 Tax=Salinisphaera sp. TaxID=1914330 RepID=UPI002D769052|nr:JDVT-CTERM system glutamic-type intramembrane protease [Salinisphaera sp.]HET7314543.1 JDVT-CTERM system glutamic-type intramembrane protease [Salinisphaera sp.]
MAAATRDGVIAAGGAPLSMARRAVIFWGLFWGLALAGIVPALLLLAWATPLIWRVHWPGPAAVFWFVVVAPGVEEIVFRGGLQEWALRRGRRRARFVSRANLGASLAFAGAHLLTHAPVWAALMLVPSLVFGIAYERRRRLIAPVALHALYNACFLGLLGASGAPALLS